MVFDNFLNKLKARYAYQNYSSKNENFNEDFSFTQAAERFPGRNELYHYMHHFLHHKAPVAIRNHRNYFSKEQRGFGEDALHAMWFTLLREFKPEKCLEIGVYRGQVITLWGLASKLLQQPCVVHGISPFSPIGDEVSNYITQINYYDDTMSSNKYFGLSDPVLVRGLSTDKEAVDHIKKGGWDLIYIDGSHDYDIALADYQVCRDALKPGGLLVMDDSSLGTDYAPPVFSFAGHPGPSQVVQEFAMKELILLGGVGHNNIFQKPKI